VMGRCDDRTGGHYLLDTPLACMLYRAQWAFDWPFNWRSRCLLRIRFFLCIRSLSLGFGTRHGGGFLSKHHGCPMGVEPTEAYTAATRARTAARRVLVYILGGRINCMCFCGMSNGRSAHDCLFGPSRLMPLAPHSDVPSTHAPAAAHICPRLSPLASHLQHSRAS
jgi:hypothetical protein